MKKKLLGLVFTACLSFSSLACAGDFYYDYLSDNNTPDGKLTYCLIGGHMGTAGYMSPKSVKVVENKNHELILKYTVKYLDYQREHQIKKSGKTQTVMTKYDLTNMKMYEQYTNPNTKKLDWMYIAPTGSMAETGHYFAGEAAFYQMYKKGFYSAMISDYVGGFVRKNVDQIRPPERKAKAKKEKK